MTFRKSVPYVLSIVLATAAVISFTQQKRNRASEKTAVQAKKSIPHFSVTGQLYTGDKKLHLATYSSLAKAWADVRRQLERCKRDDNYFAPPIHKDMEKEPGNCFSAAIGVHVEGDEPPCPGMLAQIMANAGKDTLFKPHHPDYDRNIDTLAVYLAEDGILLAIPKAEEQSYFPVIGLIDKYLSHDFHFIRPSIIEENGKKCLSFSERAKYEGVVNQFDNISVLEKKYDDNQQFTEPHVFYVPVRYLEAKLDLNYSD